MSTCSFSRWSRTLALRGSEKADALAHEACKPECCNDIASEGVEIREDIFWPHVSGKKIHNAPGGAAAIVMDVLGGEQASQADPNPKDTASQSQVNDLRKGLKKIHKAGCSQEASQTRRSMYWHGWRQGCTYRERSAIISGQALQSQHQW